MTTPHALDLWTAPLDREELAGAALALLDADERDRAARFRTDLLRTRFVVSRLALRSILAQYLPGVPPATLQFALGNAGKPFLPDYPDLRFNLSHSEDLAVVAVVRGLEVGIDVEHRSRMSQRWRNIARAFSLAEQAALTACPDATQPEQALRIWVCKEAFIKGTGAGFQRPLTSFDVDAAESPRLVATRPDEAEAGRWRLSIHELPGDYLAAVAVAGEVTWRWRQWA